MSDGGGAGAEFISVAIGQNQYAIDIMSVREIRGWTASTPMPHAPAHVLGMINLRGLVLPVVDLGACLGVGAAVPTASSVVVVIQIDTRQVGLLVDAVCDIIAAGAGALQPPPDVDGGRVKAFVRGVMTTEHGIVSVLTLDRILPPPEVEAAA
jgi:purine-binding chemotaxis protein CheW